MLDVVAGFDIGGTKVSLVVADSSDEWVHRSVEATDVEADSMEYVAEHSTYHGLAAQLVRMLRVALVDLRRPRLGAIGIVSAGPIRDGGLWSPPNILPARIEEAHRDLPRFIPLVDPLRKAFSRPVDLLNDCNGAVLGEVFHGLGKEASDKGTLHLAYATISTGFGVGAWDGGRLVLGKDGNAGELGHTMVREDGLPCGCGNRGCVEAYCSGSGILANARGRLLALDDAERVSAALVRRLLDDTAPSAPAPTIETLVGGLTPALVFEAAEKHDPIARSVVDDAVFAAGVALSTIANAYDPAVILVGGSIALAHPELLEPIRGEMLRHLNVIPPEVRLTSLGAAVTEWGAIAVARRLLVG